MGILSGAARVAGAALIASCVATPAFAAAYSGLYVFGDSLSDTGNIYAATKGAEPVAPPYSDGRFSNGNLWIQDVASSLGLGPVTPSVKGGNDFAFGGAQTGQTLANPYDTPSSVVQAATDLTAQVGYFGAQVGTSTPNALFSLWIGSNDVDALLTALAAVPTDQQAAYIAADLQQAIGNIATSVNALAADGMKNLLALDVTDLGKTPDAQANGPVAVATASALSLAFDQALSAELTGLSQEDGFTLTLVDTYNEIDQIVASPTAFGLTNATNPCWTGTFTDPTSGTLCAQTQAGQDQYLFWDGLHPTAAGHQLVADAVLEQVPEPGSAGLLLIGAAGLMLLRRRRGAA